jgi:hypothetical protein
VNRKLVVFVPPESLDAVRGALFDVGPGRIGAHPCEEPAFDVYELVS